MDNVSFETRIENAKTLLQKLMDPKVTLEESVKLYKAGKEELVVATKLLDEAKLTFKEYLAQDNNL